MQKLNQKVLEENSYHTAIKMKVENLLQDIEIPEGVTAAMTEDVLTITGSKGTVSKKFDFPSVDIRIDGSKVILSAKQATKRQKKIMFTYRSHINNLIKGSIEGFVYKVKICSGHFPMSVAVKGNVLEVKNFLGEKVPRVVKLKEGATVKIEGDIIRIEALSKEVAGQVAADIEQLTRITNRDRRVFQDGLFIIEKAGKNMV